MIKVIEKVKKEQSSDLDYWLSKTPEERLSCVENLRRQYSGNPTRLQRTITVFQRRKR